MWKIYINIFDISLFFHFSWKSYSACMHCQESRNYMNSLHFLNARSITVESDDEKIKDKLITKNYTVSDSYIYILTVTW
jgi:dimeric dUTPase (all-alpha-NTP-PPase superfamily)